jgi:2-methylisocitrate lyase-like PEP mutase family enzyme
MEHRTRNWKRLLKKNGPLLLPAASDALTAKLIQQAGFPAYQIGGFALDGMRFGFPDMDVNRLGEKSAVVRDIVHACDLPVLVDCDDGYGDEKNVTNTIHVYDSPSRRDLSQAGADGVYVEGPETIQQLRTIGREFKGKPLATSILEGGGKTPWVSPDEMHAMGFNMLLYPTTVLFQVTKTFQRSLAILKAGRPMSESNSVTMLQFEKIVDIAYWKAIEQKAVPLGERVRQTLNKIVKKAS